MKARFISVADAFILCLSAVLFLQYRVSVCSQTLFLPFLIGVCLVQFVSYTLYVLSLLKYGRWKPLWMLNVGACVCFSVLFFLSFFTPFRFFPPREGLTSGSGIELLFFLILFLSLFFVTRLISFIVLSAVDRSKK